MLTPTPDGKDSGVTTGKVVGTTYRKFVLALATIGVVAGVATIGFVLVPSTSSKVPSNAEEATISTALRAQEHASEIETSEVQDNVLTTTNGDDLDPDLCWKITGFCRATQENFNRPKGFDEPCPENAVCSSDGYCECKATYCAIKVGTEYMCKLTPKPAVPKFMQQVRVRKEWRTLDDKTRIKVGAAFQVMAQVDTLTGRKKYGPHFWNAQDLVVFHVCAVVDPRCDQAHFGPNFMTFHRAYLLMIEQSLRAVDPTIIAMPYWNMALDAQGGKYRDDKDKYIFTDKYFGEYFAKKENNFVVDTGLFKNWPVPEWIFEADNVYNDPSKKGELRYGKDSDMGRPGVINKISTCVARGLYVPAQPGTKQKSSNPKSMQCTGADGACGTTDQVHKNTHIPGNNVVGQGAKNIPDYCSAECKADSTKCTLYARSDHYSCEKYVQRNPADPVYSNRFASNTNDITYTKDDFDKCTNPRWIGSWMEWQNCIEKRTDGVCELRLDTDITHFFETMGMQSGLAASKGAFAHMSDSDRQKEIRLHVDEANEAVEQSVAVLAGKAPDKTLESPNGGNKTEFIGLANVQNCANPMGYYDTLNGRMAVNNMHAQGHIRIGLDMFDTGTSSADMGAFHGHHAHVDMSNMYWMIRSGKEGQARTYGYPPNNQTRHNSNDWLPLAGKVPYGTSGPFSTYSMTYCRNFDVSYRYNGSRPDIADMPHYSFIEGGPWIDGTALDDVISEHYPFFNLYSDHDGGDRGYTHRDIIEHSAPDKTDYTYDYIQEKGYYPNVCENSKDCPNLD